MGRRVPPGNILMSHPTADSAPLHGATKMELFPKPSCDVMSDWEEADACGIAVTVGPRKPTTTTVVLSLSDELSEEEEEEEEELEEEERQPASEKSKPRLSRENDPILGTYLTRDIYFEVVDYDSNGSSDGKATTASSDEADGPTEPFALWPTLLCTSTACNRSPTLGPLDSNDLLSGTPPAPLVTDYALRQPPMVARSPSCYVQRGSWGLFLLDEALERRYAAALVLTGGVAGLPVLPIAVARMILEECLNLAPWFAHFAVSARVDVTSCLHVRKVDLSHAARLKSDAADLIGWLMRHSTAMQSLDVSGHALGTRGAAAIGRALPLARHLRSLRLNDTQACSAGGTDPSGLLLLAAGVRGHPALTKLGLRANALGACSGHAALRALVAALGHESTSVRCLDLSANPLGFEGAALLAQAIAAQPRLTRIEMASCALTGKWGKVRDGVRALAAAVAASTTLEVLDLTDNALGRSSEAMDQWRLDERNVTACPAVFLVEALRQNHSLQVLRLGCNRIVGDQEARLRDAWAARGAARAEGLQL